MREKVFYDFLLDNVDFVDDLNRPLDARAEDGHAIQPSPMTFKQKYINNINSIAFYVRPRNEEQDEVETTSLLVEENVDFQQSSSYHTCVICLTQERNMVFGPCHHLCACSTCGANPSLTACPLCRTAIYNRQVIYV
jgi:hypothetical protein